MDISQKVAYLKGLAEGLNISDESNEGRVLLAMLEVLEEMSDVIDNIEFDIDILSDEIDSLDEDFDYMLEDTQFEGIPKPLGKAEFSEFDYDDYEGELYEIDCPGCKEYIILNEEMLDEGEVICPRCGIRLEIDFVAVFDGPEDFVEDDKTN